MGEGAYSGGNKRIIYMVVSGREISEVKRIVADFDQQAFVSVINVHEVEGEGFTYLRPKSRFCNARQQNQKDNPILPSYLIIKKKTAET